MLGLPKDSAAECEGGRGLPGRRFRRSILYNVVDALDEVADGDRARPLPQIALNWLLRTADWCRTLVNARPGTRSSH